MRLTARVMIWAGVLIAAWALWAVTAHADEMDIYDTFPIDQKCGFEVRTFLTAVESREKGHARKILHIDRELMDKMVADGRVKKDDYGRVYMPMDGMYVNNWNTVSQRTRDFMEKIIYFGWDMADAHINKDIARIEAKDPEWKGKINAVIAPETKNEWATQYFQACLQQRAGERRVKAESGFVKVQSEEIQTTPKYESYGVWKRIEGCMNNRGHYFQRCLDENQKNVRSEHDMIKMFQYCDMVVLENFFDCAKLYPQK